MKERLRDRIATWLERFTWLRSWLLRYDGEAPAGQRYVNRLNGYTVVVHAGEDQ